MECLCKWCVADTTQPSRASRVKLLFQCYCADLSVHGIIIVLCVCIYIYLSANGWNCIVKYFPSVKYSQVVAKRGIIVTGRIGSDTICTGSSTLLFSLVSTDCFLYNCPLKGLHGCLYSISMRFPIFNELSADLCMMIFLIGQCFV